MNLFVENSVLCELYPLKRNSCDEMDSVRLQARDIYEMQDYIDAQSGGPGKGFFRIVTDPFQARKVIADGKLAVVLGIEVSELFNCSHYNYVPDCNKDDIDRQLDEVYKLGVRDMELVNKFDNALAGVAGDGGAGRPRRQQRQQVRDEHVLGLRDLPDDRGRQGAAGAPARRADRQRAGGAAAARHGARLSGRRRTATRAASPTWASTSCGR